MEKSQHGSRKRIEAPLRWAALRRIGFAIGHVLAPARVATRASEDTPHPDAFTVRPCQGASPSFAVTPTLYFHADTNAAVALTVGVESVATHRAAAQFLAIVFGAMVAAALLTFMPLAQAQPQTAAAPPVGTVTQLAGRIGVQTCLDATRRFGPALTGTSGRHAAVVMSHPVAPDAAMLGVTIERNDEAATSLVSATFAPTQRGGCDLSYDKVDVWRKSCQDVALEELRYTGALERLGEQTVVIPYSPTHQVYLIRIAGGCVSVTKELVFP